MEAEMLYFIPGKLIPPQFFVSDKHSLCLFSLYPLCVMGLSVVVDNGKVFQWRNISEWQIIPTVKELLSSLETIICSVLGITTANVYLETGAVSFNLEWQPKRK